MSFESATSFGLESPAHKQYERAARLAVPELALDMLDWALIVVDHEGRLEYRNRLAAAQLKSGRGGLTLARGIISAKVLALREQLMQAIRAACKLQRSSGVCVPQPGTPAEAWPRMVVVPVVGASGEVSAAVWVLNTEAPALPSEDLLSALFLLSPAEARLAIGLLKGLSAAECAQQSGVGVATIRSQLHSIFSKTGVRRQAQLVALLSKVPVLRLSGGR